MDVADARAFRESLRALVKANNGMALQPGAVATLNRIVDRADLRVSFDEDGAVGTSPAAAGIGQAFGRLLVPVLEAQADGTWRRLKACRQDECHWVFYDASRNAAGVWCSMAICGSRSKMRAYRRRRLARR